MNIQWSQQAINSYLNIIDYLLERWTKKEVQKFQTEVNELVELLKSNTPAQLRINKL